MDIPFELARVIKSAAVNTDLACRFALAELHAMAEQAAQVLGVAPCPALAQ